MNIEKNVTVELKNICPYCGIRISSASNFCSSCGNKIFDNKIYKNTAIISTIVYVLIYILFFMIFGWLSELGDGLSGGSSNKLPSFLEISRTLSPCFFFSFIPFCISLIYSKKAQLNVLFYFNVIILVIHIIFIFI